MFEGMSDTTLLRIGIAAAALVLLLVIPFISRGKPGQGTRTAVPPKPATGHHRQEPTLREILEAEAADAHAFASFYPPALPRLARSSEKVDRGDQQHAGDQDPGAQHPDVRHRSTPVRQRRPGARLRQGRPRPGG